MLGPVPPVREPMASSTRSMALMAELHRLRMELAPSKWALERMGEHVDAVIDRLWCATTTLQHRALRETRTDFDAGIVRLQAAVEQARVSRRHAHGSGVRVAK